MRELLHIELACCYSSGPALHMYYDAMGAGCAIGVNDMRNPVRPVLRTLPFLPEVIPHLLSSVHSDACH